MDLDGQFNYWSVLWWCIKWGGLFYIGSLIFLACTGQLPSDPG